MKRVAIPAAFGLVAVVFFLIVVIALFAALFYWLTSLVRADNRCADRRCGRPGSRAHCPPAAGRPATASAAASRAQSAAVCVAFGADCASAGAEATPIVRLPVGGRARHDGARLLFRQEIGRHQVEIERLGRARERDILPGRLCAR